MTAEVFPLNSLRSLNLNNTVADLVERAVRNNEGRFAATGSFVVETGQHLSDPPVQPPGLGRPIGTSRE